MNIENGRFGRTVHIGLPMRQLVAKLGLGDGGTPTKPEAEVQAQQSQQQCLLDLASDSEVTRQEYEMGIISVPRRKWSTLKRRVQTGI